MLNTMVLIRPVNIVDPLKVKTVSFFNLNVHQPSTRHIVCYSSGWNSSCFCSSDLAGTEKCGCISSAQYWDVKLMRKWSLWSCLVDKID